jgi:AcrR family transcriptional regulator
VRVPRKRAADFELQRAGILQAAAELFARRSFAGASMAQLAQACGVSKALLYHYYRDKEHLLFDIADCYVDGLLAIVEEVQAGRLPPRQQLATLVRRFMHAYQHAQAQHMVLVQDVKFLSPARRTRIVAKQRAVVEAFAQAIAAVKPRLRRKGLRIPLAMMLFGMINWTFTWLRAEGPLTYDDMADVAVEVFLHGVAEVTAQQAAA